MKRIEEIAQEVMLGYVIAPADVQWLLARVRELKAALGGLMDEVSDMPADASECYASWADCEEAFRNLEAE